MRKRAKTIENDMEEISKKDEANKIKSDNFPRSNREMSNIANVILEKRTI